MMNLRSCGWHFALLLATCVAGSAFPSAAPGEEPVGDFLEALRQRKMFDMALDYIDRMADSPLVSPETKQSLPYERGATLIISSAYQRDYTVGEQQLDEAQKYIADFVAQHPQHPRAQDAQKQLGYLYERRADLKLQRAASAAGKAQAPQLKGEAQQLFDQARKVYLEMRERQKGQLESINKQVYDRKTEQDKIDARELLRADYVQTRLYAAGILEYKAEAYPAGSKEAKELLTQAAAEYGDIYSDYRLKIAGQMALAYQGRCEQKLGNLKDALSYFTQLLDQPESDAFRDVRTLALQHALECWLDPSQDKFAEAVNRGLPWVDKMRPVEAPREDWAKLRLTVAQALKRYSDELLKKNPRDKEARNFLSDARKLARAVLEIPGEHQDDARLLLTSLPGGDQVTEVEEPENFEEAKKAGGEAVELLQAQELVLETLPPQIASEKDPQLKQELQARLEAAQQKSLEARQAATAYFELALTFADPDTPPEEVNLVRYFLSYLKFLDEAYYDAAVYSEFVTYRFPDSSVARNAAKIAMASYVKLYALNTSDDKRFESERLTGIAEFIARTWPGQPEAIDALTRLIPFRIKEGRLLDAQEFLSEIPEGSPDRADAEIRTGLAIWRDYRQLRKEIETRKKQAATQGPEDPGSGSGQQPTLAELEENAKGLRETAHQLLAAGIGRVRANPPLSQYLSVAALSLAASYLENGQAEEAIDLLNDKKMGPLTLVARQDPNVDLEGFAEDAYRTALRAYIGALPTSKQPQTLIQAATGIMQSLKESVGDGPDAQQRLIAVYYSLAVDLEEQIVASQTVEQKKLLSQGFETFVSAVGQNASELNVLQWVARTLAGLGTGFDTDEQLTPDAKKYYERALEAYQKIVDKAKAEPEWIDENAQLQIRIDMAETRAKARDYSGAVKDYAYVLVKRNNMLTVQMDAARGYQQEARQGGKNAGFYYTKALMGGYRGSVSKRNIVWGWNKLVSTMQSFATKEPTPENKQRMHECRLNRASCYREYALLKEGEERTKFLKIAKSDILNAQQGYPDLGGDQLRSQYNSLLKNIQKDLGEPVTGLPPGPAAGGSS